MPFSLLLLAYKNFVTRISILYLNIVPSRSLVKKSRSPKAAKFLADGCFELHYALKAYNFRVMQKFYHLFRPKGRCVCTRESVISHRNCINNTETCLEQLWRQSCFSLTAHPFKWLLFMQHCIISFASFIVPGSLSHRQIIMPRHVESVFYRLLLIVFR